jgi:hypothetical protein
MHRNPDRTALAWQFALAAYMQLISWVPLGRWNFQPCCPTGIEQLRRGTLSPLDALGAVVFLLPAALFWVGWRWRSWWIVALAIAPTMVWLALQLWTWWPPYVFGASDQWSRVYARAFAQSTPILPRWGTHLPPDGMHFVLQVLLAGCVTTGAMMLARWRTLRRGEAAWARS